MVPLLLGAVIRQLTAAPGTVPLPFLLRDGSQFGEADYGN